MLQSMDDGYINFDHQRAIVSRLLVIYGYKLLPKQALSCDQRMLKVLTKLIINRAYKKHDMESIEELKFFGLI